MLGRDQVVLPIMTRFKLIETCLECSSKKLSNVGEVFYYALKAVLHPIAPLFDPFAENGNGALKPLATRALKRIFLMCDMDKVLCSSRLANSILASTQCCWLAQKTGNGYHG